MLPSTLRNTKSPQKMSPLLRLPAELRLQIYEYHYELSYKELPWPKPDIQVYWSRWILPSGLARTNRLIYTELQDLLRRLRKSNTPDLALRLPLLFPLTELLGIVKNVAAQNRFAVNDVRVRCNLEACLAGEVKAFARKSFNKVQKQYDLRRAFMRRALKDRARPTDGLRLMVSKRPSSLQDADLALLQDFVRKAVLRMRNSADFTFRIRIIVDDREEVRAVKMRWIFDLPPALAVPNDFRHGMRTEVSLARRGGWGKEDMAKLAESWPVLLFERVKWVEADEMESWMVSEL